MSCVQCSVYKNVVLTVLEFIRTHILTLWQNNYAGVVLVVCGHRFFQLFDRIRFAHKIRPISQSDIRSDIQHQHIASSRPRQQGTTRCKAKPDGNPPAFLSRRLLISINWSANWFACVHRVG